MFRTYANALWQTQRLPRETDRKAGSDGKRGHPPTKLTAEQVLECRSRHEFHNWNALRCSRHYGTSQEYMRNLLGYITRRDLIARPEHANLTSN